MKIGDYINIVILEPQLEASDQSFIKLELETLLAKLLNFES